MTQKHESSIELFSKKLTIRIVIGLVTGFIVISLFIFRVPHPSVEWGTYWLVRPLIVTPLAGALCGASYHIIRCLFYWLGWSRIFAIIAGIVIYVIGIWMGIVLGLVGTLWN